MNKQEVYNKSPLWLKIILINIKAKSNVKKRFTEDYSSYLEEYKQLWKAERNEVLAYQKDQLEKLLLECYNYSVFYKKRFKKYHITEQDIKQDPFKALYKLPLLSKEDRRSKVEIIVNKNSDRITTEVGHTSGTSGSPTLNYIDTESITRAFALWNRFHFYIGIKREDRRVRFSGHFVINPERSKPPFWLYNKIDNQLIMSTYHLKMEYLRFYVKKLNKFKPTLLDGYPSAIFILAKYINQNNIKLSFIPKAICTTAETLYDYQRDEIQLAFNCSVYNQYASAEGSPFITECTAGHLHINEDSGVFEFLNQKDEVAQPGEIARLVVTSFRNWKTPLLRYDILDTVLLAKEQIKCTCGCQMPFVDQIIGREDDILWTKEKGYIGRMSPVPKGLSGVLKTQFIQKNPNLLVINLITNNEYNSKVEQELIKRVRKRLGRNIKIKINLVNDIPLGANGKFDAVKREFEIDL